MTLSPVWSDVARVLVDAERRLTVSKKEAAEASTSSAAHKEAGDASAQLPATE